MTHELFRYFFRKNYPNVPMENRDLDFIHAQFMKYMDKKCSKEVLERIMPVSEIDVLFKSNELITMHGFHPAINIHFDEFVREQKEKFNNEQADEVSDTTEDAMKPEP